MRALIAITETKHGGSLQFSYIMKIMGFFLFNIHHSFVSLILEIINRESSVHTIYLLSFYVITIKIFHTARVSVLNGLLLLNRNQKKN